MRRRQKQAREFFVQLCELYYEKVLRYLHGVLGSETAARECTQEVFLTACGKQELLEQHPNPGGFLFQTAKNLARKSRSKAFAAMLREEALEGWEIADRQASVETVLDRAIDEHDYIEAVLSRLSEEKQQLYRRYYHDHMSYALLADEYGMQEAAVRMRYVRLRRELVAICKEVAEEFFGT